MNAIPGNTTNQADNLNPRLAVEQLSSIIIISSDPQG